MSGDVTEHFSRHEFDLPEDKARKRGCEPAEYPAEWAEARLLPLCRALEVIRAEFGGRPIRIISAYRPLPYNRAVGSKDDSQHLVGRAADFQIDGVDPGQIWNRMIALRHVGRLDIGGAGVYNDFCHVDVRGGSLHTWDERTK
jgi:uncharacterized protein YcbK (DUF882 family)